MGSQPGLCPISTPKGRKGSLARKTHTLSQEPPVTLELLEAKERPTKAATTAGQTPAPSLHTSRCGAQALPLTGSRTPLRSSFLCKMGKATAPTAASSTRASV